MLDSYPPRRTWACLPQAGSTPDSLHIQDQNADRKRQHSTPDLATMLFSRITEISKSAFKADFFDFKELLKNVIISG